MAPLRNFLECTLGLSKEREHGSIYSLSRLLLLKDYSESVDSLLSQNCIECGSICGGVVSADIPGGELPAREKPLHLRAPGYLGNGQNKERC